MCGGVVQRNILLISPIKKCGNLLNIYSTIFITTLKYLLKNPLNYIVFSLTITNKDFKIFNQLNIVTFVLEHL